MVKKENAVSPVVGIMLMIVVTVVIAGVVGLVASGVINSASTDAASEPQIEFVGLYTSGYTAADSIQFRNNPAEASGLLFKVVGGNPADLTGLKLTILGENGNGVSIGYDDYVNGLMLPGGFYWANPQAPYLRGKIGQPEYMRGHRIILFGMGPDNPNIYGTTAEPGDMFLIAAESIDLANPDTAIGILKDGDSVPKTFGINGNSVLSLSNSETGRVYLTHTLMSDDVKASI